MTDRDTDQAHDLFELLRKRRMHRRLTGEPVPKEAIEKLVWAAGRAPAGGNARMRNLLVVTDPAVLTTLRQVTPSFGATGASAVIVLCTDTGTALREMGTLGRDVLSLVDAGAAAANITLVAAALGLGVCFVRSSNDAALGAVLDMPATVRADLLIAIGWPVPAPLPAAHRSSPPIFWNSFATGSGGDHK
jgi:nitroreductase